MNNTNGIRTEDWTCGKGLAANASLPAAFAEIMLAVAENLEVHMGTLDLLDEASKLEFDAYEGLVHAHRKIGTSLDRLAREMENFYRLPMGRHDERKLASPRIIEAFEKLIDLETELHALLDRRHKQHQLIVSSMHTV